MSYVKSVLARLTQWLRPRQSSRESLHPLIATGERFAPLLQPEVPWAKAHLERYRFASTMLLPTDSVLDLACGVGYGTDLLFSHASTVLGIDCSQEAIDYATSTYRGGFRVGTFLDTVPEAPFDVCVSYETIEHINVPLKQSICHLASMTRRLLIGSVPYREQPGNCNHFHFGIGEEHLQFMQSLGQLEIYFQEAEPGSSILPTRPTNTKTQNLMFVLALNGARSVPRGGSLP